VAIAREIVAAIAGDVQGVQIGAAGGNLDSILRVIQAVA
jgi:hypothetical protein